MDLSHAFSYTFEDKAWVGKIVVLAGLLLLSAIFPFGLITLAAALGYMVEIIGNVRNGLPRPLPRWEKWQDKILRGGLLMIVMFLYHLPILVLNACVSTLTGSVGSSLLGGGATLFLLCCTLPMVFVYNSIIWTMLAVGTARYAETGRGKEFFRISTLFSIITENTSLVLQWLLYTFIVNMVFMLLTLTIIGFLVTLALTIPVHGHILGQFARTLGAEYLKPKRG